MWCCHVSQVLRAGFLLVAKSPDYPADTGGNMLLVCVVVGGGSLLVALSLLAWDAVQGVATSWMLLLGGGPSELHPARCALIIDLQHVVCMHAGCLTPPNVADAFVSLLRTPTFGPGRAALGHGAAQRLVRHHGAAGAVRGVRVRDGGRTLLRLRWRIVGLPWPAAAGLGGEAVGDDVPLRW